MALSPKSRQELKAKAHKLKPIVLIGNNGLSEAVKKEINRALDDHELIKIKISAEDREAKKQLFDDLCETLTANPVQLIGNIGVIYRRNPEKKAKAAPQPKVKPKSKLKPKRKPVKSR